MPGRWERNYSTSGLRGRTESGGELAVWVGGGWVVVRGNGNVEQERGVGVIGGWWW